ncbi:hypothetical protein BB390_06925 [Helicobacter pylori]|uniref:hypothetical protein n=1 Tax=Helicobacter pylori TaxID=210 RepID=UPI000BE9B2CE|nr:hypothetical protein [Helicobacter pylori]PDW12442.1 hypothetical protein BB390_06925 [Helicobacter pylori]
MSSKFKGSKFKFYIYGGGNGQKDSVIFSFHFDWKKDTQDWYEIDLKDFSEVFLTLESKIKELRQKHEAKVKSKAKEEEIVKHSDEKDSARYFEKTKTQGVK